MKQYSIKLLFVFPLIILCCSDESKIKNQSKSQSKENQKTNQITSDQDSVKKLNNVINEQDSKSQSKENQKTNQITSDQGSVKKLNIDLYERDSKVKSFNNNYLFILSFILMGLITIISLVISFYLYRWRRIVTNKNEIMVPETFESIMTGSLQVIKSFDINFKKGMKEIKNIGYTSEEKIEEIKEIYMQLQNTINEKENEINRFKEGYDTKIFISFLKGFINVDTAIKGIQNDFDEQGLNKDDFNFISKAMDNALYDCGVNRYEPKIGTDIRDIEIGDDYKKIETENKEKEYKIAEVIEAGYIIEENEKVHYIKPAKVSVFVPKN
jgi:molecular chaperone GrpE (heat shock protein)